MPLGGILSTASAGLGLIKGVAGFFGGKSDEEKAREELGKLKTPFYKIQDEYYQNRNLAAQQAEQGLPSAVRDYNTTENQRGFGSSIGAIEQVGGSPSDIAKLYSGFTDSVNRTGAADAEMQFKNMQYFMNQNQDLAAQKTKQWAINEYDPYQKKLKEITQRISAAKQNQNNSLNDAIGSIGAAGTSMQNQDLLKAILAKKQADPYTAPQNPNVVYNAPTNNTAQDNPVSFRIPNQEPAWAAPQTDVNGNQINVAPQMPSAQAAPEDGTDNYSIFDIIKKI